MSFAWSSCSPVKAQVVLFANGVAAGHFILDLLHHFVVVVPRDHVAAHRYHAVQVLAFDGAEGGTVLFLRNGADGDLTDLPGEHIAERDAHVHELLHIIAILILQAHVDLVVIIIAFDPEGAHFLPEKRGTDGIGDGIGAHVEPACLLAVDDDRHLRFGAVDVDTQGFDTGHVLVFDEFFHVLGFIQQTLDLLAPDLDVDGLTHRRSIGVLQRWTTTPG
jgi:hypothetical protein